MTKFRSSGIIQSITNAVHGLNLAFFSQRNFVIEVIITIFVLIAGIFLKFTITDLCLLIVMSAIVLICELLNSVIEFTLDAVYKNSYSRLVEMAKDISAGMVLLSCILSAVVGALLFCSYIYKSFM